MTTRAERLLALGLMSCAALAFAVDGDAPSALVVAVFAGCLVRLERRARS